MDRLATSTPGQLDPFALPRSGFDKVAENPCHRHRAAMTVHFDPILVGPAHHDLFRWQPALTVAPVSKTDPTHLLVGQVKTIGRNEKPTPVHRIGRPLHQDGGDRSTALRRQHRHTGGVHGESPWAVVRATSARPDRPRCGTNRASVSFVANSGPPPPVRNRSTGPPPTELDITRTNSRTAPS